MKITIELLPERLTAPCLREATVEAIHRLAELTHIACIEFDPFSETAMARKLMAIGFPPERMLETRPHPVRFGRYEAGFA
jgi:hypothetical protein